MRPMPELNITELPVSELVEYANNAKLHPHEQVDQIAKSIEEFGNNDPIAVWHNPNGEPEIVEGHGRLMALKKLGIETAPVICLDHLTDEQRRAYALVHNKLTMNSDFDFEILADELASLNMFDMGEFGFEFQGELFEENPSEKHQRAKEGILRSRFIAPPFSVLDSRQGYWKDRKREWHQLLPDSRDGRENNLMGDGLLKLAQNYNRSNLTATSEFDPVLCEIIYQWFAPKDAHIIDPFAGGHVRGAIADILGLKYTGIELRQEQVDVNNEVKAEYGIENAIWICDDSMNVDAHIDDDSADLIIACPPYADLEVYSDDPRDISNMDYEHFLSAYNEIITRFIRKLKQDRFAVFVVGDVRDSRGFYRDFISATKKAFQDNGMGLYNEIILIESMATAPLRAKNFSAKRKVVKGHQNVLVFYKGKQAEQKEHVLVFYKGNPRNIKAYGTEEDVLPIEQIEGAEEAVKAVREAVNKCDTDEPIQ